MLVSCKSYLNLVILMTLVGCGHTIGRQSETAMSLDPDLIKTAIDSTLSLGPGLNTGSYLLDLGVLASTEKRVANEFVTKYRDIPLTNLDSLFKKDKTWLEYQFFDNPVIRFDKVLIRLDGTIQIRTSKYKASDGSIGTEMIFRRSASGYECLKSEITWIS